MGKIFSGSIISLALALGMMPPVAAASPGSLAISLSANVTTAGTKTFFSTPGAVSIPLSSTPLVVKDGRRYVVRGQKTKNGTWAYPAKITSPPGVTVASVELGFNPRSHTQLLEIGRPTTSSLQNATGGEIWTHSSTTSDPSGSFEVVWHDFAGISLAIVKDSISWTNGGGYVSAFTGSEYLYNNQHTGWALTGSSFMRYFANGHTKAVVQSGAGFLNAIFCPTITQDPAAETFISVQYNHAVGHANGMLTGYVNTWASGGCTNLIGYYTIQN